MQAANLNSHFVEPRQRFVVNENTVITVFFIAEYALTIVVVSVFHPLGLRTSVIYSPSYRRRIESAPTPQQTSTQSQVQPRYLLPAPHPLQQQLQHPVFIPNIPNFEPNPFLPNFQTTRQQATLRPRERKRKAPKKSKRDSSETEADTPINLSTESTIQQQSNDLAELLNNLNAIPDGN
jgi:hypothetical protein